MLTVLGIERSRRSWQIFRRWDQKGWDVEGDRKVQKHLGVLGISSWVHYGGKY